MKPPKLTLMRFTIVEMLIVIAILAILLSLLQPSLMRVQEHALRVVCKKNLQQTVLVTSNYTEDYGPNFIVFTSSGTNNSWASKLTNGGYTSNNGEMLACPLFLPTKLEETVIIISADHGENQGELGIYEEHGTADQATCRIPMIIRWPGGVSGHVDRGLHYNLDLLPTFAEMFGVKPRASWDGQSFAPAILNGADCGRDELIISQLCGSCQRSVRWGDWLYIRTYHDSFRLFPREMLFNLAEDPHEQYDLASERPELCQYAASRLLTWHDNMMATQLDGCEVDPLWTVMRQGGPCAARGRLKRYCERLEETDRSWAVPKLKLQHPREFS